MRLSNLIMPTINPIRLRPVAGRIAGNIEIDYSTYMPRFNLMTQRTKYQQGINAVPDVYPSWILGKEIAVQFQINSAPIPYPQPLIIARLVNATTGTYTNMTQSTITPVGWVGYSVRKFRITPPTSDYYYLYFRIDMPTLTDEDYTIYSDIFYVSTNLSAEKKFIDIQFKHSENKFNYVFDAYYRFCTTGLIEEEVPQLELSTIEEESYNVLNSNAIPKATLTLTELHKSYIPVITQISRCNDILINGMSYLLDGAGIEMNPVEKSDICNPVIKLKGNFSNDEMLY